MDIPSSPLIVEWLLSDTCNLKCSFCSAASTEHSPLPLKEVLKVAQHLVDLKVLTVMISGREPLMHPLIYDVITILSEGGVDVLLFTNGTLVDGTVIRQLVESGVSAVQVSIEGKEKIHDTLKGVKGAFKKSLEAVKNLRDSPIRTGVCTTVFKENIDQITDIAYMLSDMGVTTYSVRWCMPCGRAGVDYSKISPTPEQWHNTLSSFLDLRKELNMELISMDPLLVPLTATPPEVVTEEFAGCGIGRTGCAIRSDGAVIPCAYLEDVIGYITEKSLRELWSSPAFDIYRTRETFIGGKCTGCIWSSMCAGGCKARSVYVHGTIAQSDPLCWVCP
jgi:radical SAM protein with 4Fe4S-binding SPASM domain